MDVFLFLIVNIVFLSVHIVLSSRLSRGRVLRKGTSVAMHTALVLMLLSYPLINQAIFGGYVQESLSSSRGHWEISALYVMFETVPFLLLSPYFWTALIYYLIKIFFPAAVRKGRNIKGSAFGYYREDLLKIHPGLISFVYKLREDPRSDIASILMKLKLEGHIVEQDGELRATGIDASGLFTSEKTVLAAVRGEGFDLSRYYDFVANEAMELKLIKRPVGGGFGAVLKIFACLMLPAVTLWAAVSADDVLRDLYDQDLMRWPGGVYYFRADKDAFERYHVSAWDWIDEIDDPLERMRVRGEAGLYNVSAYSAAFIETPDGSRVFYGDEPEDAHYFVRLDLLLGLPSPLTTNSVSAFYGFLWTLFVFSVAFSIALIVTQVKAYGSAFVRTAKGAALASDAFGLKNFLADFSIAEHRESEELPLWEYYLIYAVALDVNIKIEDELIAAFTRRAGVGV